MANSAYGMRPATGSLPATFLPQQAQPHTPPQAGSQNQDRSAPLRETLKYIKLTLLQGLYSVRVGPIATYREKQGAHVSKTSCGTHSQWGVDGCEEVSEWHWAVASSNQPGGAGVWREERYFPKCLVAPLPAFQ